MFERSMKLRTWRRDGIIGIGKPDAAFSIDDQVMRMIMKVVCQSVGKWRGRSFSIKAHNATRSALTAVELSIRRERQSLGTVCEPAELSDRAIQRVIAEDTIFRRH